MQLTTETIYKLDRIIENHNKGNSDVELAEEYGCHIAQIRAVLALVRKLGTPVRRNSGIGRAQMSAAAKAILRKAMSDAHKQIAALNGAA